MKLTIGTKGSLIMSNGSIHKNHTITSKEVAKYKPAGDGVFVFNTPLRTYWFVPANVETKDSKELLAYYAK